MPEMPSEEQALRIAAEKRKVPVDYLLKILALSRDSNLSRGKQLDQTMTVIRKEADGREISEDSSGRA